MTSMITTDAAAMLFTQRPLFGGAMTCDIPTTWRDVSDVRQVPDHQECWQQVTNADGGGTTGSTTNAAGTNEDALLVIEILQRQDHVTDTKAAEFFFTDLAESNGITNNPEHMMFKSIGVLPATTIRQIGNNPTPCFGIGLQKIAMGRDYDIGGNARIRNEANGDMPWVRVELCVVRLPNVETDILITISKPISNPNEPPAAEEDGTTSQTATASISPFTSSFSTIFQRVVTTLQIHDRELFG